jgi:putative ABC transport system permease protein
VSGILRRSSVRYLLRHPWHTTLSVLGVALGVAVVFSIDLVNRSATAAFRLSTDAVTGRATHHVVGSVAGVADSIYTQLRAEWGIRQTAPVVEGYIGFPQLPGRAFLLFGIDPFAEAPFRSRLRSRRLFGPSGLAPFMLTPGAVHVPAPLAAELGVARGDRVEIRAGGRSASIAVTGILEVESQAGRGFDNVLITDVATAQEILGMTGRLSRIDLIVPRGDEGERLLRRIRGALPPGADIVRSQSRTEKIESMTVAFSQNLFALSLLALVVGMFLIYNTMTFSVVQRRGLIGDLRTLGVTRRAIFGLVLTEAAAIGLTGTAIGLVGGLALARALLGMVTQTINDLYFVLSVRDLDVTPVTLLKAIVLGVGATLLSAALPAREATRTPPRFVQNRSVLESRIRRSIPRLTVAGFALLAAGTIALALPFRNVFFTFAGLLPLIAGFAVLTPGFLLLALDRFPESIQRAMGPLGRLAIGGIVSQLSRSAVAISALAIAVGTTVGVTVMIDSFRTSVVEWLNRTLDADIYVSRPYVIASRNDGTIDPALTRRLLSLDGVAGANLLRGIPIETQHGVANLIALDLVPGGERKFRYLEGGPESAWPLLEAGTAALVSEPYAYRHGVSVGDSVVVMTAVGYRAFDVAGVYSDYASDLGTVMIHLDAFRRLWSDDDVSGIGLALEHPDSAGAVMRRINAVLQPGDELLVRSHRDLRDISIEIFDRTFAITYVLRTLTVVVAFIGVLSALMALQFERGRELGVLRAIGLTPGELWRLVTVQTGLMGFVSGLISLPFGLVLAAVLIFVVNKRSFGWTLEMHLSTGVIWQAMVVAVAAAVLAGLYPGYKMARTSPARALREE